MPTWTSDNKWRLYTNNSPGEHLDAQLWEILRSIAQVCQQIRAEARLFPYSSSSFVLNHAYHRSPWLGWWTRELKVEQRSAISRIEVWDCRTPTFGYSPENLLPQLKVFSSIKQGVIRTQYPEWRWLEERDEVYEWAKAWGVTVVIDAPFSEGELQWSKEVCDKVRRLR